MKMMWNHSFYLFYHDLGTRSRYSNLTQIFKDNLNKSVLLRERKRHTDRRLSSTPCAVPGGGVTQVGPLGYPHPDLARGVPWAGPPWLGYPLSWPGQGYPRWVPPWLGSPILTWPGGYPGWVPPGWGTPQLDLAAVPPPRPSPSWTWLRYPPCGQTDRQTDGWMDRHVSKHNLPVVLRTRSVTNRLEDKQTNMHTRLKLLLIRTRGWWIYIKFEIRVCVDNTTNIKKRLKNSELGSKLNETTQLLDDMMTTWITRVVLTTGHPCKEWARASMGYL